MAIATALEVRCHGLTSRAIASGKLVPKPCEVCGIRPTDAHHDDYSKPLEVRWLCRGHHRRLHAQDPNGITKRRQQQRLKAFLRGVACVERTWITWRALPSHLRIGADYWLRMAAELGFAERRVDSPRRHFYRLTGAGLAFAAA